MRQKGNKVALLGEPSVGKSAIALRLARDIFQEKNESTVGAAYFNITTDKLRLDIWDTAGQERYLALAPMYYRDAKVMLLVFDVTKLDTLDRLVHYIETFITNDMKNYACIVVGNKTDLIDEYQLKRKMSAITEKFERFALLLPKPIEYVFTSAKNNSGIIDLKNKIINLCLCKDRDRELLQDQIDINNINLADLPSNTNRCTC